MVYILCVYHYFNKFHPTSKVTHFWIEGVSSLLCRASYTALVQNECCVESDKGHIQFSSAKSDKEHIQLPSVKSDDKHIQLLSVESDKHIQLPQSSRKTNTLSSFQLNQINTFSCHQSNRIKNTFSCFQSMQITNTRCCIQLNQITNTFSWIR